MPAPDRLGKYIIRREIGRGAMGTVYEGWDPHIERHVAIKVLRLEDGDPAHAAEVRMRFRREAQAAGRLSHPNIVAVYDYGEVPDDRTAFIAMELVAGRDLKTVFDSGRRFTQAETERLMAALLAALQHAHERGVVHRDIKPGNILLLDDGGLKVADFGIAKLDTSELTQTGMVLGTMSHMSPEQLSGRPADCRSDVFSSAVILYQLLTGEHPFKGSPATVMNKVLNEHPPPASSRVAALPRAIDAVISKAMAKQPQDRYATAGAFAAALATALSGAADPDATIVTSDAAPARRRRGRAGLLGALAAAGSVTAGVVAWTYATRDAREGPMPSIASPAAPASAASAAAALALPPEPIPPHATPEPAPSPRPAVVLPSADEIEQAAWDDAVRANTVAAYEAYLKGYAQGRFAHRARVRIAALRPPPPPRSIVEASPPPPPLPTMATPSLPAQQVPPVTPPASAPAATAPPLPAVAASAPTPRPAVATAPSAASRPATRVAAAAPPAARPGMQSDACAGEARRDDARCLLAQGLRYRNGDGVPRDFAEALRWFGKAAERGLDAAQYELGLMHERGQGVSKNDFDAVAWFRKAAEQGHARAQAKLGRAYEYGEGAKSNAVLAAQWYGKAAEQGLAPAQSSLGYLYLRGRGVFKDTARASELFQRAAERGDATAMYWLGWMAQHGEGQPRDTVQAARWYRRALAGTALSSRLRQEAAAYVEQHPTP
jgi:TPR repeat protein